MYELKWRGKIKIENVIFFKNLEIPFINSENGEEYYPIRYILEKVLLKSSMQLHNKNEYKPFIKKIPVDFSFKGTTVQECYCMNKIGWIKYLESSKYNQNRNKEKIDKFLILADFFGANVRATKVQDINEYNIDCIENYITANPSVNKRKCLNCNRELPRNKYFFNKDNRVGAKITNVCRTCNGGNYLNIDEIGEYIYTYFGLDGYIAHKNDNELFYYNHILSQNTLKIQIKEKDRIEIILKLIKRTCENNLINNNDLNMTEIRNKIKNINFSKCDKITNKLLNEFVSEGECKLKPYLYKNYQLGTVSYKEANIILNNYIHDNKIEIDDIFKFNKYTELLKFSRLTQFESNILKFVVQYYGYQYPGYKFKTSSSNYYKEKDMRILDVKYLVERDLKIPIIKTPLYLTKYTLNQRALAIYSYIRRNKMTLFELVNEAYPDIFIEADFELNPYRSSFDSLEEAQIDDILRNHFKNIIYNDRSSKNLSIEVQGMYPDWIIVSENGCMLVEYFGLYSINTESSSRLKRYKRTMNEKLIKYKELESKGYKSVFIYPDDLKDEIKIIEKIKNT